MPHKDPTKRREYHRDYKRVNRHRYRPRAQAYDAAKHANSRAARYRAPGTLTADEAQEIFNRGSCAYCGSTRLLGLDHVEPLHAGGLNRPENIALACGSCNASKWRGDRPGRWSRDHDACIDCGDTARPHICHGRCSRCYQRVRRAS